MRQGGHRARAGGRHGLAVRVILDVPRCEDTRGCSSVRRAWLVTEVPWLVVVEPVEEQCRVRVVADCDEEAIGLDLPRLSGDRVGEPDSGDVTGSFAQHVVDDGVQDELDLLVRARSTMIGAARNSSRRWTITTLLANLARNVASSIAESPPPTTTTTLSRKNAPSQVAQ